MHRLMLNLWWLLRRSNTICGLPQFGFTLFESVESDIRDISDRFRAASVSEVVFALRMMSKAVAFRVRSVERLKTATCGIDGLAHFALAFRGRDAEVERNFQVRHCSIPFNEILRATGKDLRFVKKVYPESVSRFFRNPNPLILLRFQELGGQCRTRTCDLLLVRQAL